MWGTSRKRAPEIPDQLPHTIKYSGFLWGSDRRPENSAGIPFDRCVTETLYHAKDKERRIWQAPWISQLPVPIEHPETVCLLHWENVEDLGKVPPDEYSRIDLRFPYNPMLFHFSIAGEELGSSKYIGNIGRNKHFVGQRDVEGRAIANASLISTHGLRNEIGVWDVGVYENAATEENNFEQSIGHRNAGRYFRASMIPFEFTPSGN